MVTESRLVARRVGRATLDRAAGRGRAATRVADDALAATVRAWLATTVDRLAERCWTRSFADAVRGRAVRRQPTAATCRRDRCCTSSRRSPACTRRCSRPPTRRRRAQRCSWASLADAVAGDDDADGCTVIALARGRAQPRPRVRAGRDAPSVELHLWVRELTRIDRAASLATAFRWSDDGDRSTRADDGERRSRPDRSPRSTAGTAAARAGASSSPPTGARPRHRRRRHPARPRHATRAGSAPCSSRSPRPSAARPHAGDGPVEEPALVPRPTERAAPRATPPDEAGRPRGPVLPVLTHRRRGRRRRLARTTLPVVPAAGRHPVPRHRDRDHAVGGAVDAVRQHRPRRGGEEGAGLHRQRAGRRAPGRVRAEPLAQPDPALPCCARPSATEPVQPRRAGRPSASSAPATTRTGATGCCRPTAPTATSSTRSGEPRRWPRSAPAVRAGSRRRLLLRRRRSSSGSSRGIGRTLELTGSRRRRGRRGPRPRCSPRPVARVDEAGGPGPARLARSRRHRTTGSSHGCAASSSGCADRARSSTSGSPQYIDEDGDRYFIWGGRPARQGMPAFPTGRAAPAFPRVGGGTGPASERSSTPSPRRRAGTPSGPRGCSASAARDGAELARAAPRRGWSRTCVLTSSEHRDRRHRSTQIPPTAVVVVRPSRRRPGDGADHLLVCDVCRTQTPGTPRSSTSSTARRAWSSRCAGHRSRAVGRDDNFYRRLYASADMQARRRPGAHRACSTTRPGSRTRTGSRAAATTPARPTCWSRRRPWRWASTSATCPRSCWPRCRAPSRRTCSASAAPAASPATRSTSPSSPAAASSCPGWATRCR